MTENSFIDNKIAKYYLLIRLGSFVKQIITKFFRNLSGHVKDITTYPNFVVYMVWCRNLETRRKIKY